MNISDLIRDVKNNTTKFIKDKNWLKDQFSWQSGFGAFSYSHSEISRVYNYIQNQELHHQKFSFKEEYIKLLTQFQIEYNENYLFDFIE